MLMTVQCSTAVLCGDASKKGECASIHAAFRKANASSRCAIRWIKTEQQVGVVKHHMGSCSG